MYPKDIYTKPNKPANGNLPAQCWSSTQQADFSLSAGYDWDGNYGDWYDHYPNPTRIADNFCTGEPKP
jgi:hypothetical protein